MDLHLPSCYIYNYKHTFFPPHPLISIITYASFISSLSLVPYHIYNYVCIFNLTIGLLLLIIFISIITTASCLSTQSLLFPHTPIISIITNTRLICYCLNDCISLLPPSTPYIYNYGYSMQTFYL